MKRLALLLIAISLSCVLSLLITDDLDVVQPDRGQRFRIWQSFIHDGGGYRDTTLRVILCTKDASDLDTIFREIQIFHDNMNGKPDSLTIYLYKSKKDFLDGNCFAINTFQKGENEDEKETINRNTDCNNGSYYEHDRTGRTMD